jgi:hypothetical protein
MYICISYPSRYSSPDFAFPACLIDNSAGRTDFKMIRRQLLMDRL